MRCEQLPLTFQTTPSRGVAKMSMAVKPGGEGGGGACEHTRVQR